MKIILTLMLALAAIAFIAPAAYSAETASPSDVLTYTTGADIDTPKPVTINWKGNWLSISSIISSSQDYTQSPLQAYVNFGAYPSSRNEPPVNLSIRVQGETKAINIAILPEKTRECIETISQMASITLAKDKEAGKLGSEALQVLEKLRDRLYSFTDMQGSFINLNWSHEYSGNGVVLGVNFSSTNSYSSFKYSEDSFSVQLRDVSNFGLISAEYKNGRLTGSYRIYNSHNRLSEDEAAAMLLDAIDTIFAIFKVTKQPAPDEIADKLRLARKAITNGFASYEESQLPAGMAVGGT